VPTPLGAVVVNVDRQKLEVEVPTGAEADVVIGGKTTHVGSGRTVIDL
jgi:hypothetical protein